MGQRLVISVIENSERIATIYFHWSGYTKAAYMEVKDLLDMINGIPVQRTVLTKEGFQKIESAKVEEQDTLLKLIRLYESLGGGLSNDSHKCFEERYPRVFYKKEACGTYGLIDFTEEGMKNADELAEETATICLDTRDVEMDCFCCVDEDDIEDEIIEFFEDDPFRFSFEEMDKRCELIDNCKANYMKFDDEVYEFIH